MITYCYKNKKPEKERVAVPKDAKEKLKEIYRSLGIAWEKNKDLVRILTIIVCVVVFFIACVVSDGSLFPAAAALFLLFTLWENNNVSEQEECVEA